MKVKQRLIAVFENNRGRVLSGETLAELLGCSRAAVWKAVTALRAEGYRITASTNKGYVLEEGNDVISGAGIEKYLGDTAQKLDIRAFTEVGSTNTVIRELAAEGAAEWTAAIAGMQTAGRGRLGRSFFSPSDTGLYLSILLRPDMPASEAVKLTTAAAVAVAQTVEEVTGKDAQIKWVNDVYLDGRKVCGILTEASFSPETGGLEYAVPGIGVNVYEPEGGFPEEIKDTAGAVFAERREDMRNRIAGGILRRLYAACEDLSSPELLEEYRRRLMWIGEEVKTMGAGQLEGTVIGVDENYALILRSADGSEHSVSSGEISIRRKIK